MNKKTPSNVIAVPYYSEMSDDKKTLIENIGSKKSDLRYPKTIPFDSKVDETTIHKVPPNTYKRVIIVATKPKIIM